MIAVLGAWISLWASGETQRRQIMPTRSGLSQCELPATFGLDHAAIVDKAKIRWPDQQGQELKNLAVDRLHFIWPPARAGR